MCFSADIKHPNVICDGCTQEWITGIRWKCVKCNDYDLCTSCYLNGKHRFEHEFERMDTPKYALLQMDFMALFTMGAEGHYITMLPADWSIPTSHDPLPSSCHSEKMLCYIYCNQMIGINICTTGN